MSARRKGHRLTEEGRAPMAASTRLRFDTIAQAAALLRSHAWACVLRGARFGLSRGPVAAASLWLIMTSSFGQTFLRLVDDPIQQANAAFGFRVVRLGDVNGDGVPD